MAIYEQCVPNCIVIFSPLCKSVKMLRFSLYLQIPQPNVSAGRMVHIIVSKELKCSRDSKIMH